MIDKENSGFAGRMILLTASSVSAELKTYSSWMLGAFGAAIGLLVSNVDKLDKYICHDAIARSVWWFGVAVFLNVLQLYFASQVAGAAAAVAKVKEAPTPANFDLKYFCSKLEQSTFWLMRHNLKKANAKLLDGDYAAPFMRFASLAQVQGLLVLGQMGVLIYVLFILANAISA